MESGNTVNLTDFNYVKLDNVVNDKYTLAEYLWVDGSGKTIRSKTKTIKGRVDKLEQLEWWTYDGSSCE
jgi:glutamine synthetase